MNNFLSAEDYDKLLSYICPQFSLNRWQQEHHVYWQDFYNTLLIDPKIPISGERYWAGLGKLTTIKLIDKAAVCRWLIADVIIKLKRNL